MEKLLKLLNEYHHFNSDLIGYFYDDEYDKFYFRTELPEEKKEELKNADALIDDGISEVRVEDERIISKSFGFIQRLVEHNKLLHPDFVQHLKLFYGDSMPESNFYLMMLSIADRPIYELNKMLRP